jgi:vacuolar protein sorting-associated protein VTA1
VDFSFTRQTADTFLAAATFLELCQIWGDVDPDIISKIKFAKYHAIRIAKAIKNGEDPNLSNPVVEPEAQEAEGVEALNPDDPEVRAIEGTGDAPLPPPQKARQPSVEEVPDEADRIQRSLAKQSTLDESLHPSRSSSLPPQPQSAPELPSAPSDFALPQAPSALPDTPKTFTDSSAAFQSFPPPPVVQMSNAADPAEQPTLPSNIAKPVIPNATPPVIGNIPPAPSASAASQSAYEIDANDQSITQAQKHARWAVSALSFDDVNTAIKELKIALRHLGAE